MTEDEREEKAHLEEAIVATAKLRKQGYDFADAARKMSCRYDADYYDICSAGGKRSGVVRRVAKARRITELKKKMFFQL